MRPGTRLTAVIAVLALAAAGCGGNGGGGNTTTTEDHSGHEVTLNATEFKFDPSEVEVDAGSPIKIVLVNQGVIEHDFAVEGMTFEFPVAQPGQTVDHTVTFAAGTYVFYCTIAGHREAGMEGTLVAR
jgi:uncharacterized cupredoxin-like copper-binding protein